MFHNAGELADWDNSLFAKELAELQQLDSQKANVGTTARLRWAAGTLTTPSRRSPAGRLNRGSARASASEVTRQESGSQSFLAEYLRAANETDSCSPDLRFG